MIAVSSAACNDVVGWLMLAVVSTLVAVSMGTITAYGFSRFRVAGQAATDETPKERSA